MEQISELELFCMFSAIMVVCFMVLIVCGEYPYKTTTPPPDPVDELPVIPDSDEPAKYSGVGYEDYMSRYATRRFHGDDHV